MNIIDAEIEVGNLEVVGYGHRIKHAARRRVWYRKKRRRNRPCVGDWRPKARRRADSQLEIDRSGAERARAGQREVQTLARGQRRRERDLEWSAVCCTLSRYGAGCCASIKYGDARHRTGQCCCSWSIP